MIRRPAWAGDSPEGEPPAAGLDEFRQTKCQRI